MAPQKYVRKRLFVDPRLQGALAVRVAGYWLTCLLAVVLMLVCWRVVTDPAQVFEGQFDEFWAFWPALAASLILLPIVVYDVVQLSNRFAGPMFRLRRAMHDLARGQPVRPVHFRRGDFWQEFAEDFNTVAQRAQNQPSGGSAEVLLPEPNVGAKIALRAEAGGPVG
jgi:hypothetical protein